MLPKTPRKKPLFFCDFCDFNSGNKKDFSRHLNTAKHIKNSERQQESTEKTPKTPNLLDFSCNCGKRYTNRTGLWRHMKKCDHMHDTTATNITSPELPNHTTSNINNSSTIFDILKQNQEFKTLIIEQQKENYKLQQHLLAAMKDTTTINHNTINNNNNQKFNLNFFLNTTCKDAMNMSDFIEDIQINFKDIEDIGKDGYVSGMTNLILSRIRDLDITKRPLHCTDLKREIMYIKDNNEWCKDSPKNDKLRDMISIVAKQNFNTVPLWRKEHPECNMSDHPSYNLCMDMMRNIIGDVGSEQARLDNKVIKNISKHIFIK
jgi:hypothetical protein